MNKDYVVDKLILDNNIVDIRFKNFSIKEVLLAIVFSTSLKNAATILNVSDSSLEHFCSRHLKSFFPDKSKNTWSSYLLNLCNIKKCTKCNEFLDKSNFYKDNTKSNERRSHCKKCSAAADSIKNYNKSEEQKLKAVDYSRKHYKENKSYYISKARNRDEYIKRATPKWANIDLIDLFYSNRPEGFHVDHIIPLKGENVCGLHVENNLQYLSAKDNRNKSNKFTDTLAESA